MVLVGTAVLMMGAAVANPDALNAKAAGYYSQGNYRAAEPLYVQALEALPDADVARHGLYWNNLAALDRALGRYKEAESLYAKALPALASAFGVNSLEYGRALGNRAELYVREGKAAEAESDARASLAATERTEALNVLALALRLEGRLSEAEDLLRRSLTIRESGVTYTDLAELYSAQGRFQEAETCARRALSIYEKTLGPDHPLVAVGLNGLAQVLRHRYAEVEVEPMFIRALAIWEKTVGQGNPDYQRGLANLNDYYASRGLRGKALEARRRRSTEALSRSSFVSR